MYTTGSKMEKALYMYIYIYVCVSVHACFYLVAHTKIPTLSGFVFKMYTTGSKMEKALSQARTLSLKADAPYYTSR